VDTRSRTVDNFKKLGCIPFYDEVKINKCILVFKKLNGDVPSYIDKLFITNQSIHSRQTRHGGYNLVCPGYTRSSRGVGSGGAGGAAAPPKFIRGAEIAFGPPKNH
jgi:hypothetical protein